MNWSRKWIRDWHTDKSDLPLDALWPARVLWPWHESVSRGRYPHIFALSMESVRTVELLQFLYTKNMIYFTILRGRLNWNVWQPFYDKFQLNGMAKVWMNSMSHTCAAQVALHDHSSCVSFVCYCICMIYMHQLTSINQFLCLRIFVVNVHFFCHQFAHVLVDFFGNLGAFFIFIVWLDRRAPITLLEVSFEITGAIGSIAKITISFVFCHFAIFFSHARSLFYFLSRSISVPLSLYYLNKIWCTKRPMQFFVYTNFASCLLRNNVWIFIYFYCFRSGTFSFSFSLQQKN